MNCCGSHGKDMHEQKSHTENPENCGMDHHIENHESKKTSWFFWLVVLLVIGLLVFSLLR